MNPAPRRFALLYAAVFAAGFPDWTGCTSTRSIDGAFAAFASAVSSRDSDALFLALDEPSRWSIHSIHRAAVQIRDLVRASYPPEERARAGGRWEGPARAPTPEAYFALYCAERDCFRELERDLGGLRSVERHGDDAIVVTARGRRFAFHRGTDRRWGASMFTADLDQRKVLLRTDLEAVQRNVALYTRTP